MKKILLSLFLIATSMETARLSAYCVYNWSENEKITIVVFPSKLEWYHPFSIHSEAVHRLEPGGSRRCKNWKTIDKKNRKRKWYWIAYKGTKRIKSRFDKKLGKGYFPIGGTITFAGYDKSDKAQFKIKYDGKPWRHWESPWNYELPPWQTYKR